MVIKDFKAFDGATIKLHIWDEVQNPKAVVQIVHGMAEHSKRYSHIAEFLNQNGYIVVCDDHRAHGETVGNVELQGKSQGIDLFEATLRDEIDITKYSKETYNLPVYIFGHSYGSFISQRYYQTNPDVKGIILCGSNYMNGALVKMGLFFAKTARLFRGKDAVPKLVINLSFGAYDKKFGGTNNWLCDDEEVCQRYNDDQFCGKHFSSDFYVSFFKGALKAYSKNSMQNTNKDLPLLIIAGEDDPVGDYSKGVKKLYDYYQKHNLSNVKMTVYPKGRHEIHNDKNKMQTYNDILNFFETNLT